MKASLKLFIGFVLVFLIIGCIAENYNFDPPILTLINYEDAVVAELELVNLDWIGERNTPIKKETADVLSVAKQQEPLYIGSRKKTDIEFSHYDFEIQELTMSLLRPKNEVNNSLLWREDEKKNWEVLIDGSIYYFMTPLEKGKYTMTVDLTTNRGTAQYVGILIVD